MVNEQKNITGAFKNDLRATRILHLALLTGMVLFALVSVFISEFITGAFLGPGNSKDDGFIFLATAGVLAIVCVLAANRMYRKKLREVKTVVNTLSDKFNQYRSALISYLALCEAPGFFSVIVFLLTGDYIALGITALLAGAMILKQLTPSRIITDLELDWKEQQDFFN